MKKILTRDLSPFIYLFALIFIAGSLLNELKLGLRLEDKAEPHETQPKNNSNGYHATSALQQHNALQSENTHPPQIPPGNTYYSWRGNQWIPPPGIPTYSTKDFIAYFQNRNVLFIGDSTSRRTYSSLFAAMNAEDISNVHVSEINSPTVIDQHRGQKKYSFYHMVPSLRNSSIMAPTVEGKGKFDYINRNCLIGLIDFCKTSVVLKDYDLMVVMIGAWTVSAQEACGAMNITTPVRTGPAIQNTNPLDHFREALDVLKQISSPDLQVALRTVGYIHAGDNDLVEEINNLIKDYFNGTSQLTQDGANMTLVDWASAIRPRSFNVDRIKGDTQQHYGLEARLLCGQMLLHQLRAVDSLRDA